MYALLSQSDAHTVAITRTRPGFTPPIENVPDGSTTAGSFVANGSPFAFDAGEGLTEHTSPFDAFVWVLDGRFRLTVGGKPVQAASGHHRPNAGERAVRRGGG